jgi:hypothetical protein
LTTFGTHADGKPVVKIVRNEIQRFIRSHVENHPDDIAKATAEAFGITRRLYIATWLLW